MRTVEITSLHIYPVKSMRGIALDRAKLTSEGLENDRRWMVVRSNGRFVTQRDMPQMSLVHTSLEDGGLVLSRPGYGSVTIPYELHAGDLIKTKVWNDDCETIDQGDSISSWLTSALASKEPLRLVKLKPGFKRVLSKSALMAPDTSTYFADAAPILLANEASLDSLNSVLESSSQQSVPMNRFRPNIVVKGLEAFAEHKLDTLTAPDYQFKLCFPCKRCIVTTINQDSAEKDRGGQPFKTLQKINPMPGENKTPLFGEYVILTHGENKSIAAGDLLD